MLSSIRKFSSSIYAKILLGIVIIPFVFWGMGSSFIGGNKNIVVKINKDKFSTQDFVSFIQSIGVTNKKITSEEIDELLSVFIGNKLIEREYEFFGIKLSDISLGKLIKNQKEFKRENKFSRIEYEKFLIKSNLSAVAFETNMIKQVEKEQLFNFIGGGIVPSSFLVNVAYNQINQKRDIELINNGIDTSVFFPSLYDRRQIRQKLGISESSPVVPRFRPLLFKSQRHYSGIVPEY